MSDEQEATPDLHFWRYNTPTGMCDHPITVTNRATLWAGSWQTATTEAITVCLDCDQIFQLEDRWRSLHLEIGPPEGEHVEISSDTETVDEGEQPTGFRGSQRPQEDA